MKTNTLPKITIEHRGRGSDDPTPYQANAWFADGRDYHALGATPAEAVAELGVFWQSREERTPKLVLVKG